MPTESNIPIQKTKTEQTTTNVIVNRGTGVGNAYGKKYCCFIWW